MFAQSAIQQTLLLPALLPGPVLGLADPKLNLCLQAKRLTLRQCNLVKNVLFYLFTTSTETLPLPNENIGRLEAQMLRQTLQRRLFVQKRQEACLRDTLPCKAVRVPGPELGGREARGWGRYSSQKKWGSHAQHSFFPAPEARPRQSWPQDQGSPAWGRGGVTSSRTSLWESSRNGLTGPQLWAPFCKQRSIRSQISFFLARSQVDVFSCYAREGHGSTD